MKLKTKKTREQIMAVRLRTRASFSVCFDWFIGSTSTNNSGARQADHIARKSAQRPARDGTTIAVSGPLSAIISSNPEATKHRFSGVAGGSLLALYITILVVQGHRMPNSSQSNVSALLA